MSDNELKDLIRSSSPPPNFPASFEREVWQSISVSESRSLWAMFSRFTSDHLTWLVRPAGAVATVMSMLIIGAGLGGLASAKDAETEMKAAYTASINPILSAHAASEK